ncbi:MAG: hypothetical protein ACM3NH_00305 [Candidatus Saccharibacteria bacterium]
MSFESDYRQALASIAAELNVRPEEFEKKLEALSSDGYAPTEQCLTLGEIRKWPLLPFKRSMHSRKCRFCRTLTGFLARPDFLVAAENQAAQAGISAQEILDDQLQALDRAVYITPECLEPYEYGIIDQGRDLPPERTKHAGSCLGCGAMLMLMLKRR